LLYPNFGWDEPAYHLEGDPEGRLFSELLVDVVAAEVIEPLGRRQVAHGDSSARSTPNRRTGTAKCNIIPQFFSLFCSSSLEEFMKRARFFAAATLVGAVFAATAALAQTPPPMSSVLAGKKFTPPLKGAG